MQNQLPVYNSKLSYHPRSKLRWFGSNEGTTFLVPFRTGSIGSFHRSCGHVKHSGAGRQYSLVARIPFRYDPWLHPNLIGRNHPYTAIFGGVHIRSTRREKPTAPGATLTLKIVSGPYVLQQPSRAHFHNCLSGALLDFVTACLTIRHGECNLSPLPCDLPRVKWLSR